MPWSCTDPLETPSSAPPASSQTLPSRKRYRGTSEPMADTKTDSTELEDEDTDSEDEETAPEGQQQQAIPTKDTAEDETLDLGYEAAKHRTLE
ncbi:hypothetical protein Tco_0323644 [Tanacetum coccineum]